MTVIDELINKHPLGTEFVTLDHLGDTVALKSLLGDKFKVIRSVIVLEGEYGQIELDRVADGYNFDDKSKEEF